MISGGKVKERPILFTGAMVRALLDGSKTQTRRVLRDQGPVDLGVFTHGSHLSRRPVKERGNVIGHRLASVTCPYGQPGGALWVREAFRVAEGYKNLSPNGVRALTSGISIHYEANGAAPATFGRLRPSIHMPRAWSRITLEITAVRVERLNQISLSDVRAEGCEVRAFWTFGADEVGRQRIGANVYRSLWESINGPGSWGLNPWVWVVSFRRNTP